MENKLEQLLNSLIERGWNVFGHKDRINAEKCNYIEGNYYNFDNHNISISLRELVSKESGLWQFVCDREHRFIDKKNYEGTRLDKRLKNPYADYDGVNTEYEWITVLNYKYWIIESSLKDESELEDFLLSNVVIKDEKSGTN